MRRGFVSVPMRWLVVLVGLTATSARGQAAPWEFVRWEGVKENPVFQGTGADTWDKKIRERGFILVEDGVYHLWYTGYNEDRSPLRMLGHATSPDGVRWARDAANPIFGKVWTEDMMVVKHDGKYVMFAEGKDDIAHQLEADDPVHWTEIGPLDIRQVDGKPIAPGPRGTPAVWIEKGLWYLYYERRDQGVWLATSKDRRVWTNVSDAPVLAMGPEAYDLHAIAVNQIVKRGDFYYAFYHANAHMPWKDWSSNVARSKDLVHWEKYPGNPIVKDNCSSPIVVAAPDGDRLYTMHPDVKMFRALKPGP